MTTGISRRGFVRNVGAAGLAIVAGSPRAAWAQAYPAKDVTWLLHQAPGGSLDVATRIIAPFLETAGIKTVIEHATGAGGRVARTKLFNSPGDGYTIMTQSAPGVSVDQVMFQVPYKVADFEAVYGWGSPGYQLCVKKDSPIRTFADLKAEAAKRRLTIASLGRGGSPHLQLLIMRKELDIPFEIVHFEGSSPAYAAVAGGHVDACLGGPGSGARMADSLHFVAVLATKREAVLPNVPTLSEQGIKCTLIRQMYHADASPKTPPDRVAKLSEAFATAFRNPELIRKLEAAGEYVTRLTREEIIGIHNEHLAALTQYKDLLAR